MLIVRAAARRIAAASVLAAVLAGMAIAALAAPAQASPTTEACNRYNRLQWGGAHGVVIAPEVMTIAKQLCGEGSKMADVIPLDTNYNGDPCVDYKGAVQSGSTANLEKLGTECVGTWVRFVDAQTSSAKAAPDNNQSGSSSSAWMCPVFILVVGSVLGLLYYATHNTNPPSGGEGNRWGPPPPTLPRK